FNLCGRAYLLGDLVGFWWDGRPFGSSDCDCRRPRPPSRCHPGCPCLRFSAMPRRSGHFPPIRPSTKSKHRQREPRSLPVRLVSRHICFRRLLTIAVRRDAFRDLMSNHRKNIGEKKRAAMGDEHYGQASVKDLRRLQMNFEAGDMYEPKTFSLKKFKASRKITGDMFADITGGGVDVIDYLGLKHIDREYKNVAFLAEFTSQMGRIKHRDETGL